MDGAGLRGLLIARLAHALVYTFGIAVLRTLTWTIGFLAQAVLALAILSELLLAQPGVVHSAAGRPRC